MSERPIPLLARRQLDRRLEAIREHSQLLDRPRAGWIVALRRALGMTQAHLADRMAVSRQAISQLEKREADGSVTLKALEQVSLALGGRLVYAVVPDRPLTKTLEEQALRVATRMTGSVRHTMRLEDQEPLSDLDQRTRDLAQELLTTPTRLWSMPDGG
jgi:predicted DNA-binding mobile mystery protein A